MNLPANSLLLRAQAQSAEYGVDQPPQSFPRRRRRRGPSSFWISVGLTSGTLLFVAFLLTGSDLVTASLLCGAWIVAWAAVALAGGFRTVTGWFAFFPLFHFILFSLPLKVMFWEPAEEHLRAPFSTPLVMLLFYLGLLLAVSVSRRMKVGTKALCSTSDDPEFYRWLAWICFTLGMLAFLLALFRSSSDGKDASDTAQAGQGLITVLINLKAFSVAAYVFYAWKAGKDVWKLPTFWLFFLVSLGTGVLSSGKGETSQPIVFLLVATCSIYGLRSYKILLGGALFALLFSGVIYPVMHYARGVEGARGNSLTERISIMGSILVSYCTDSHFRDSVKAQVDSYANDRVATYLPETVGVFDRFVMIGPTDLLVSGVDESSESKRFHGFELFKLGLELMVPHFFYEDKATVGSSEFLADIAGTRNAAERTNPTWGVPAQLYYSFGFTGVAIGAFVIELVFFILINLWFGAQVSKSIWFCLIVVVLNVDNSCAAIDSMPFLLTTICVPILVLSRIVARFTARRQRRHVVMDFSDAAA